MKTNTINFTGDAMLVRALDGAITVSIPIRIRRFSGRKQVVVPVGVSATAIGEAVPGGGHAVVVGGTDAQSPRTERRSSQFRDRSVKPSAFRPS